MHRHDLIQGPVLSDAHSQPCGGSSRAVGMTDPWCDPWGKAHFLVTGHQSFSVQRLVAPEMLIGHSLNLLPLPKCTLIGHDHNFSILKVIFNMADHLVFLKSSGYPHVGAVNGRGAPEAVWQSSRLTWSIPFDELLWALKMVQRH